ncbi:hypothetical protein [Planococcus ruber]
MILKAYIYIYLLIAVQASVLIGLIPIPLTGVDLNQISVIGFDHCH